ncbi:MAG TPA: hypothetical protein VN730_00110 [Steroidobacteraceae bacterium]|nr:hypothetical protein [Steroidobacteraceae bacterium]
MSADRSRHIARRRELLELEAEVQRAALAATFARLEQRRALSWAAGAGRTALRVLAMPRVRWLLLAALLRRFRSGRHARAAS